jgi:hypothetical protein
MSDCEEEAKERWHASEEEGAQRDDDIRLYELRLLGDR